MKVAYIAGPYRAYKKEGGFNMSRVWANIMAAREVGERYWALGYACVIPHLNTMLMDNDVADDTWLEGDLEILSRCDIIIMMKSYKDSVGATKELEFAQQKGLEIIFD